MLKQYRTDDNKNQPLDALDLHGEVIIVGDNNSVITSGNTNVEVTLLVAVLGAGAMLMLGKRLMLRKVSSKSKPDDGEGGIK